MTDVNKVYKLLLDTKKMAACSDNQYKPVIKQ